MKLGILSTLFNRPYLTKLFLDRLAHLKNKFDVIPVVVGSENEFEEDCEKRGIIYTDHVNKPLGSKWNHGMRVFRELDITHVMVLGSDDFISDDFVEF